MTCARLGAVLVLLLAAASPSAAKDDRPNIVLIVSDDQAYTDFGFMGHRIVKTPHLDDLARRGAVFPNGYVPTSLCRASLATLLTGRYGHEHGVCFNDPPADVPIESTQNLLSASPTLPRLLS
ncbi:MAG: sulfatase-like hydrolase/transferase, partial [Candidatus Binatia bacterium]